MGPKYKCSSDEDDIKIKFSNKEDESDYQEKRARNNVAVKKSRERSRQKQRETLDKVNRLRSENQDLEMKVTLLSKELQVLRNLFLEHAGASALSSTSDICGSKCEAVKVKAELKTDRSMEVDTPTVNKVAAKMDHEYSTKSYNFLS